VIDDSLAMVESLGEYQAVLCRLDSVWRVGSDLLGKSYGSRHDRRPRYDNVDARSGSGRQLTINTGGRIKVR